MNQLPNQLDHLCINNILYDVQIRSAILCRQFRYIKSDLTMFRITSIINMELICQAKVTADASH